jgi:diguanylate cyclase (GGDEF)-like protein/PAS domain S-box-containing protein
MLIALTAVLVAASFCGLAFAIIAARRRRAAGAVGFIALCLGVAVWCAAYAVELHVDGLGAKVLAAKVEYLGIQSVPLGFLLAVLSYTGRSRWSAPGRLLALTVVPLTTIALVWTNELHGLVWSTTQLDRAGSFPVFAPDYGPWFWVQLVVSYGFLLTGTIMLLRALVAGSSPYRRQARWLTAAVLAPWAGNVIYIAGASPAQVDLTPVGFAISATAVGVCLFHFRLLDIFVGLLPLSRDAMIDVMAEGVIVLSLDGRLIDANPAACAILERDERSLIGRQAVDVLGGWPAELVQANASDTDGEISLGAGGTERRYEFRVRRLRGRISGAAGTRMVVLRDITERTRAEAAVRASEARYRELVENANDLVFTTDADGIVTSLNGAGERMTGYRREEIIGAPVARLLNASADTQAQIDFLRALESSDRVVTDIEVTTRDGRQLALELSARRVDHDDGVTVIQGIARDVTERRSWEARLERQALHDSLTDLPNRLLLRERLVGAVAASAADDEPFGLMLLDLDRFKDVNDTLGHPMGDLILQQIGPRLRSVVKDGDLIARVGGDEFAVLLPRASEEQAEAVARRLLEALEGPFAVPGRMITTGASIGIAMFPTHATGADALMRQADVAMYAAKRSGSGYRLYNRHIEEGTDRLALAEELRAAITEDRLELRYQPQLDMRSREPRAVEALVRWNHRTHGALGPDQFVPLAEYVGLIGPLSDWVIRTALRDCATWRRLGHALDVSVNLSALNLADPGLVESIHDAIQASDARPGWLVLEVTESAMMRDPVQGRLVLGALRDSGIRIAMDDFGTGYSSLAQVRDLPLTEVKIDRSFITDIATDNANAAIVRAIVALARELGLVVVGEGVEDAAGWDRLRDLGCDLAQGEFISEPKLADDLHAWLTSHAPAESRQPA